MASPMGAVVSSPATTASSLPATPLLGVIAGVSRGGDGDRAAWAAERPPGEPRAAEAAHFALSSSAIRAS